MQNQQTRPVPDSVLSPEPQTTDPPSPERLPPHRPDCTAPSAWGRSRHPGLGLLLLSKLLPSGLEDGPRRLPLSSTRAGPPRCRVCRTGPEQAAASADPTASQAVPELATTSRDLAHLGVSSRPPRSRRRGAHRPGGKPGRPVWTRFRPGRRVQRVPGVCGQVPHSPVVEVKRLDGEARPARVVGRHAASGSARSRLGAPVTPVSASGARLVRLLHAPEVLGTRGLEGRRRRGLLEPPGPLPGRGASCRPAPGRAERMVWLPQTRPRCTGLHAGRRVGHWRAAGGRDQDGAPPEAPALGMMGRGETAPAGGLGGPRGDGAGAGLAAGPQPRPHDDCGAQVRPRFSTVWLQLHAREARHAEPPPSSPRLLTGTRHAAPVPGSSRRRRPRGAAARNGYQHRAPEAVSAHLPSRVSV